MVENEDMKKSKSEVEGVGVQVWPEEADPAVGSTYILPDEEMKLEPGIII